MLVAFAGLCCVAELWTVVLELDAEEVDDGEELVVVFDVDAELLLVVVVLVDVAELAKTEVTTV